VVQHPLAEAQGLGGDLQQLVVRQKLHALLQAHDPGRHQPQGLVRAGGALLDRALELLPERTAALFVLKGNERAIGFYRHRGFRFTGRELTQTMTGGELTELEMVLER
jgi:GNAT superfamily N-acetyltransferase